MKSTKKLGAHRKGLDRPGRVGASAPTKTVPPKANLCTQAQATILGEITQATVSSALSAPLRETLDSTVNSVDWPKLPN